MDLSAWPAETFDHRDVFKGHPFTSLTGKNCTFPPKSTSARLLFMSEMTVFSHSFNSKNNFKIGKIEHFYACLPVIVWQRCNRPDEELHIVCVCVHVCVSCLTNYSNKAV